MAPDAITWAPATERFSREDFAELRSEVRTLERVLAALAAAGELTEEDMPWTEDP